MPGLDGTGPTGMGPMTGRAAGNCVQDQPEGVVQPSGRRRLGGPGLGRGRGGHGRRNRFCATGLTGWQREALDRSSGRQAEQESDQASAKQVDTEKELELLRHQANELQSLLEQINARIDGLGAQAEAE